MDHCLIRRPPQQLLLLTLRILVVLVTSSHSQINLGMQVSPSTLVYSFLCIFSNISNFSNSYLDILNFILFYFFQFQTVYLLDIYTHLCMVDSLEMLGIDRHFRKEIRSVLDETYRKCHFQVIAPIMVCQIVILKIINAYYSLQLTFQAKNQFEFVDCFLFSITAKDDICQQADSGQRVRRIYSQILPPVQWHFEFYVLIDMMFLQVQTQGPNYGLRKT